MQAIDFTASENLGFNDAELTRAIQKFPNLYGRIGQLNLFPVHPVSTTTVVIEEREGVLNVLPTVPRGGPATKGITDRRKARPFVIPHIPHDDVVKPEDIQNVRAFDSTDLETVAAVLSRKLQTMRNKHSITLEHLRAGALKGKVMDGNGDLLVDLFKEFKIQEKSVDFKLGTGTTKVKNKINEVKRHIEVNLKGEIMNHVHALCGPTWFDEFTSHQEIEAAYARWNNGAALRDDMRGQFQMAGVIFEEYNATVTLSDGQTTDRLIADNECRFFPVGTQNSFDTFLAPADMIQWVNTLGQELYVSQKDLDHGKGTELYSESNPLPLCKRPALLVKGTTSN